MEAAAAVIVEEVSLETWIAASLRAAAAPRPEPFRRPVGRAPLRARQGGYLIGARWLYWSWLAGAALSLWFY